MAKINRSKKVSKSTGELIPSLMTDSEDVERQKKYEAEWVERCNLLDEDQRELVEEIRQVGYYVDSVWDFVNTSAHYPDAFPILIKHLEIPHDDAILDGIVRSLMEYEARGLAGPAVLKLLQKRVLMNPNDYYISTFTMAVTYLADRSMTADLEAMINDPKYAPIKAELEKAYRRSKRKVPAPKVREFQGISFQEWQAKIQKDPYDKSPAFDQLTSTQQEQFLKEEQEILQEISDNGLVVNNLSELVWTRRTYDEAIPVLIKHFQMPHSLRIRRSIVRALIYLKARGQVGRLFLNELTSYREIVLGDNLVWLLAHALSFIADPSLTETLEAMIEDPKYAPVQTFLEKALARSKAKTVII